MTIMSEGLLACNRLRGTVWKIDDQFVLIRFPHGGELTWPIASLGLHLLDPEDGICLGDDVWLSLCKEKDFELERVQIAKAVLNEILRK